MQIELLADENIDRRFVKALRDNGFQIISIDEESPGINDEAVLSRAHADKLLLLTEDKDFGEWVFAHKRPSIGIILLRYPPQQSARILKILIDILKSEKDILIGKFTVITPKKTRIRDIAL